jgi:gas vesicle protein
MSDHTSTSKVILALLAGATLGAVMGVGAGMLLSPNDGKTNRKKLKEKINKLTEDIHEKTENIIDEIQEELESLNDTELTKEA